jgi:hypothetical protein
MCSCTTLKPIKLTPEQLAVKIMQGNQETTLELIKTHSPITTKLVTSEYEARVTAVSLNADVAQFIYRDQNYMMTFRFWKPTN